MEAGTPQSRRSLGGLIDRTFEILLRQPVELLLVALPVSFLRFALPVAESPQNPEEAGRLLLHRLAVIAAHWLAMAWAALLVDARVRGEPLGLGALAAAWTRRLVPLLLTFALWLGSLALRLLALVVPGVVFAGASVFTPNAVALERAGGWGAVRHGRALTRGRWWRTVGTLFVLGLPLVLLRTLFLYLPAQALERLGEAAVAGLLYPILLVGQTLLFLDREAAAAEARAAAPAVPAPVPGLTPPVPEPPAFAAPSHAQFEPSAFGAFEHRGWQQAAKAYETTIRTLTEQAVPALLDAAGVEAGTRLLDIATGPGDVAAAAAARGAFVTGSDFSPNMLEIARTRHPEVEFRIADAEALPFADAEFDAATMSFLLGHLGHPERALAEALRVVRHGGRFAASWWAPFDRAVAFGIVMDALRARGHLDVPLPAGPPFDQFGNPDAIASALERAGFTDVQLRPVDMTLRVPSADALLEAYFRGSVRTAGLLRGQSPDELAGIRDEIARRVEPYRVGEGLEMPMPCWVASGVRA